MAVDTEVTSPDRLKVLGSTLEALGSRQCSLATAALLQEQDQHRAQSKNSRTLRRILIDEIRALPKQNADVTPRDKLKVL